MATPDDLEAGLALLEAAAAEARTERGGKILVALAGSDQPLRERLVERLTDRTTFLALGFIDDVPVAVAVAALSDRLAAGRLARIEALYVEPEARSVGLGEELLGVVTTWAEGHGATGLDVGVLPGVREAKNFFESAGYVARYIVMHRRLGSGGG